MSAPLAVFRSAPRRAQHRSAPTSLKAERLRRAVPAAPANRLTSLEGQCLSGVPGGRAPDARGYSRNTQLRRRSKPSRRRTRG
jgi:hypothetical protein